MQITGRSNYSKFQDYCKERVENVDFVEQPELLEQPKYAVLSAFWYWQINKCKKYCADLTEGSLLKISKIINCGRIDANCSQNNEPEPCYDCTPNGWNTRKTEFIRIKNSFKCN